MCDWCVFRRPNQHFCNFALYCELSEHLLFLFNEIVTSVEFILLVVTNLYHFSTYHTAYSYGHWCFRKPTDVWLCHPLWGECVHHWKKDGYCGGSLQSSAAGTQAFATWHKHHWNHNVSTGRLLPPDTSIIETTTWVQVDFCHLTQASLEQQREYR